MNGASLLPERAHSSVRDEAHVQQEQQEEEEELPFPGVVGASEVVPAHSSQRARSILMANGMARVHNKG